MCEIMPSCYFFLVSSLTAFTFDL